MQPPDFGPPLYLRPIEGYLLWHLQRGDTPDQAMERLLAQPKYQWLSQRDAQMAMDAARLNLEWSQRADVTPDAGTLEDAMLRFAGEPVQVGVRVRLLICFASGDCQEASVTVNAPSSMTLGSVKAAAVAFAESGGMTARSRSHGGRAYPVTASSPEIYQVLERTFDSPALQL